MGNAITVNNSNIGASQDKWVHVSVEKGPPTDLAQNSINPNFDNGIPNNYGCSTKTHTNSASINIAGTTRTEVIWGETCSVSNDEGGTTSGMVIAFIEQGHYVTAFIAGVTSSTALSSDTTLSGILSGISFVTTKPDDVIQEGGGSGGGSSNTPTYGSSTSGVTAAGTMSELSGTWATVCADASSVNTKPSDTTHVGLVIVITSSTTFTREINYYTDSACTNFSLGWYFNNTNFVEGDTSGSDTKITYTQANQTVMAKTTAGETFIEALLGSIDVTVDTAHVVSSGVPIYNLVKESAAGFYFGTESPTAYPSTAGEVEYVKQQ
jgi:hypothetical protein